MSIGMRRSPIPTVIAMTSITAMITRRGTRRENPTAIRTGTRHHAIEQMQRRGNRAGGKIPLQRQLAAQHSERIALRPLPLRDAQLAEVGARRAGAAPGMVGAACCVAAGDLDDAITFAGDVGTREVQRLPPAMINPSAKLAAMAGRSGSAT